MAVKKTYAMMRREERMDDRRHEQDEVSSFARHRAAQFQKGHPKFGGRQKGTPNKLTSILRDGIEAAAAMAGFVDHDVNGRRTPSGIGGVDGYLLSLAVYHPNVFAKLMGLLVMHEVNGKFTATVKQKLVFHSSAEVIEAMLERGIPLPPDLRELPVMKEVKDRFIGKRVQEL